jgi:hypothetical protein
MKESDSAIASALLFSEYVKGHLSTGNSSKDLSLSNWVRAGNKKNGI